MVRTLDQGIGCLVTLLSHSVRYARYTHDSITVMNDKSYPFKSFMLMKVYCKFWCLKIMKGQEEFIMPSTYMLNVKEGSWSC